MLNIKILKLLLWCVGWTIVFQIPAHGEVKSSLPRFSATFDFDPSSFEKGEYGFRVYAFSNRPLRKSVKNQSKDESFFLSYGLGFGSYRMTSEIAQTSNVRFLHQAFVTLWFDYRNKTIFEPFIGVYPGYAWEARNGFFVNPVAGTNMKMFDIDRNWNSKVLTLFFQVRGEYNTLLSSFFVGGGFIFQFF
ncbi:MAG: hypothetical protein LBF89_04785 [Bacteroidales bacterium]|jgi:hypothetical protein|nr:hypothetical protein [Bacteroidales bacterium]